MCSRPTSIWRCNASAPPTPRSIRRARRPRAGGNPPARRAVRARPGYYIRAFLNTPDAGIATPTKGNPSYVGQANMFTGLCVGGPGHCDVPDPPSDKFDRRPRHHKTPSSFRLDATNAVRALHAAGTQAFQVNLVALNLDG